MTDNIDNLSESERAALRQETLARFAQRRKDRVGESGQSNKPITPHEETAHKPDVSPTSSDPYGLPTLEEGLAYRLGLEEKKVEISDNTRKAVMEKTVGKFNAIMGLFGAEPVKLNEALPFRGKSREDKAATAKEHGVRKRLTAAEEKRIADIERNAEGAYLSKTDFDMMEWMDDADRNEYIRLRKQSEGECPACGEQSYIVPCENCEGGKQ